MLREGPAQLCFLYLAEARNLSDGRKEETSFFLIALARD
jgi:hypothetical protein